jgi:hypothetical protein
MKSRDEGVSNTDSKRIQSPILVGVIMLAAAIFGPAFFTLQSIPGDFYHSIVAVTWEYSESTNGINFRFLNPNTIMGALPLTCLRFVFVYWIIRYYRGLTTQRRAILVGTITELQILLLVLPSLLLLYLQPHSFYYWLYGPVPILLLLGLMFVKLLPEKEISTPW